MHKVISFDIEIADDKIVDIGAVKTDGSEFHSSSIPAFLDFLQGCDALCGHNIFNHDLKYISRYLDKCGMKYCVDTLYLSPLLFPKKPYHRLVKDDKLHTDELNNPLNDAKKALDLFHDEVSTFNNLPQPVQGIYFSLLKNMPEFGHFFEYIEIEPPATNLSQTIHNTFHGKICENAPLDKLSQKYPVELAYALALISVIEHDSLTPPWVLKNFPQVENVLRFLRSNKCIACPYCNESLDETKALQRFFHYNNFRNYDGIPLQKEAVKAAVLGKSLLAVFPTGGGKSITFQLPALMAGVNERGLTVIISPLQSLMKDQTDNLEQQHNITEAVTINGSLDPLERANAFKRVESGAASLLYISPESLRSKSIQRLLVGRNIVRFVIDEAHCFSSWGHDFRVDYLYIGEFISNLRKAKNMSQNIPVSCFTATAKQRVIADIRDYFSANLALDLEVFQASAARVNLSYHVFANDSADGKDQKLRQLLSDNNRPAIVYVSRTRRAEQLAKKLTDDGFPALPYHGRMDKQMRVTSQDAFMNGDINVIVATTAFGMGVDKKDIAMVIHYDISDSLENYVQEAGRAGRDESINADCYVLYADEDLNKHFNMLNQTKLSQKEIKQVWRALKDLTKTRHRISQSALEIARMSGWDDSVLDMETRVKTAINALEQSGFVKRGQNMPRVFADSILVKNMQEAREKLDNSPRFDDASRQQAIRLIGSLISARATKKGQGDDAETRIDYIADRLGIVKEDIIRVIGLMREEKILADAKDLVAFIGKERNRPRNILAAHINIESFLCGYLDDDERTYNIKEINEALHSKYPSTSIKQLSLILNYFAIKNLIKRTPHEYKNHITIKPVFPLHDMQEKCTRRQEIAEFIIGYLHSNDEETVLFSVLELKDEFNRSLIVKNAQTEEVEEALYYLLKIGAMKIEGGFLVIYNSMQIERLERDNRAQYKKEHYARLEEHYESKRQQIHIVGEYANRLIEDYSEAMDFVNDYFVMEYNLFLDKYFHGRRDEISKNITPKKFSQLFGELSPAQLAVINDRDSRYIVVAAGPGSGKTKLLTHKLASLYMMEDVKHEQMLMLTFSRAAATEFKKRLMTLIGNAANFMQITTFHSYCFDLLGKVGDLEKSDNIITQTIEAINAGEVDITRLTKTVLVIDEAQDMSSAEFQLVKTLIEKNEEMRVIAVGDDDQNIYEFRGSDSGHFASLLKEPGATAKYELVENYRSNANIVDFANQFAETITGRLKSLPIMPFSTENGCIHLHKLTTANIEAPVVNALLQARPLGTTCVVTQVNEKAINIVGLLTKKGIPARQIQTNTDFNLYDIVELRDFFACFDDANYTITDDKWMKAKAKLVRKYEGSPNLQWILLLLHDFETVHNKTKYKSDFRQFCRESKLEDFISNTQEILVSTIHQTKGREFDNIFLALSSSLCLDNAARRAIYVALTRAKKNLYVFFSGNYFDKIDADGIKKFNDTTEYPAPEHICFHLSHKDVFLGHFASCAEVIDSFKSGQKLSVKGRGCFLGDKQVVVFSAKFNEKIAEMQSRGYVPTTATVRHIVYWQGRDCDREVKIVLPSVEFVINC